MARNFTLGDITLARTCGFCCGTGLVEVFGDNQVQAIVCRDRVTLKEAREIAKSEPEGTAVQCGECEGAGGFVTDEGEDLLRFMKQFGGK